MLPGPPPGEWDHAEAVAAPERLRVVVMAQTQVTLDGHVYGPEETVEAPVATAATWLALGWVRPAPPAKPRGR